MKKKMGIFMQAKPKVITWETVSQRDLRTVWKSKGGGQYTFNSGEGGIFCPEFLSRGTVGQ